LADALELNQKILAASAMGIMAYKAAGQCVFANEAMARVAGGTVAEILKGNFHELKSWRRSGLWRMANDVLSEGRPLSGEFEETTRFGKHLWVDAHMAPFVSGGELHLLLLSYDITERKRAERHILEITDREQARIGQDLHDGLCQQLVSLGLDANALQRKLSSQNRPEAATAARIAGFLDQAITESRRLSRGLFPIRLEADGLGSALEELARTTSERFHIQCHFKDRPPVIIQNMTVATHLYRIAQEAVSNAVKHGQPRAISIGLDSVAGNLELKIIDDGVGFSAGSPGHLAGMGMYIMRYRAASIGATLRVEPSPSGGTTVSCCVPSPSG
jgi:two-component system CheB/CheR fusion protein